MDDNSKAEPSERLYTIQNDVYHYHAGHLGNGNQTLLVSDCSVPMAMYPRVEFDTQGNVCAVHTTKSLLLSSEAFEFTPGTIFVKSFFIPELWCGIEDLPEHYQEFVDHPEDADEDQKLYYPEEIEAWRECKTFVLWCNEDYYLSEDGNLESS